MIQPSASSTSLGTQVTTERLAWRILVVSFSIFVLICLSIVYTIQWFIFQSTVEMTTEVSVAQGTIRLDVPNRGEPYGVADRWNSVERDESAEGLTAETDSSTQAVIRFIDPRTDDPVASVVVFPDSRVTINSTSRPRFGLNQAPYRIDLEIESGRAEVWVSTPARRSVEMAVTSPQMVMKPQDDGHYIIDVSSRNSRVTVSSGETLVQERSSGREEVLDAGQLTMVRERNSELEVVAAERNVLENSTFERPYEIGWDFYNTDLPAGIAYNTTFEGRPVVVIDRASSNYPDQRLSHGENGLVQQELEADVSDYGVINLRATFYVAEQSLSTCGTLGTECPMMILVKFRDEDGDEHELRHGFFASHDPAQNYPSRCLPCGGGERHERVNLGTWFTYESGNIIDLFPEADRPLIITEVSFYASGHAYKTYISEMKLLVTP